MLLSLRVSFSAGPLCAVPTVGSHHSQEPHHLRRLIEIDLGWGERQGSPFIYTDSELVSRALEAFPVPEYILSSAC